MTRKRFQISGSMVEDTMNIIPPTLWQIDEQKKKYCDELNYLYEENKELRLLVDTLKNQNTKLKLRLSDLGVEYYD